MAHTGTEQDALSSPAACRRRYVSEWARVILDKLRPTYEASPFWLLITGVARIVILLFISLGAQRLANPEAGTWLLTTLFLAALGCSTWYLLTVRRQQALTPSLIWTQVLLDFSIVAVTISYTGGQWSYFNFLFVIVILEAGMLMGFFHGFVFALISTFFMLFQEPPDPFKGPSVFPYWYSFLIQITALFATAIISGHWNERINRLKRFQREILDNMVSGFLFCDTTGQINIANKAACSILGMEEAELAGSNVDSVLLCASGAECPVTTALKNQSDYVSYEFLLKTPNDTPKVVGLTTNRMLDRRNRMQALIVTFQDLTEITQMRQTMQQQDRMAAVGASATELTHEIRNPLASLRSAVEELKRNLNCPELTEKLCSIALKESEHLNGIVSSFLDFARNPELNREALDLNVFLESIRAGMEKAHPDVTITLQQEHYPCRISADPVQMRQMCDNILVNSVEAMDGRGNMEIQVCGADNFVEIRFNDSGPGIAPEKVSRIFDPFYTEKQKGIGMGLAICLRIVTSHDGSIHAAARPGGGTSMIVRLPRLQD